MTNRTDDGHSGTPKGTTFEDAILPPEIPVTFTSSHPADRFLDRLSPATPEQAHLPSEIYFSPTGRFVCSLGRLAKDDKGPPHNYFSISGDLVICDARTGTLVTPTDPACPYFSAPSAFSPDDTQVACIDGELLRIWDLTSNPPTLQATMELPTAPTAPAVRGGHSWSYVTWPHGDTVHLCSDGDPSNLPHKSDHPSSPTFLICRRTPDGWNLDKQQYRNKEGMSSITYAINADATLYATYSPGQTSRDEWHLSVRRLDTDEITLDLAVEGAPRRSPLGTWDTGARPNMPRQGLCFTPDGQFLLYATASESAVSKEQTSLHVLSLERGANVGSHSLAATQQDACVPLGPTADGSQLLFYSTKASKSSRSQERTFSIDTLDFFTTTLTQHAFVTAPAPSKPDPRQGMPELMRQKMQVEASYVSPVPVFYDSSEGGGLTVFPDVSNTRASLVPFGKYPHIAEPSLTIPAFRDFSPDGKSIAALYQGTSRVLSVDAIYATRQAFDGANQQWEAKDYKAAFASYTRLLGTQELRDVIPDVSDVLAKCVDLYLLLNREPDARRLLSYMRDSQITYTAATEEGASLLRRIAEERRAEEAERREIASSEEEARVAAVRATNKSNAIPPSQLSRADFLKVLSERKSAGVVSESITQAVFRDYSFIDTFGPPDRNSEWVDGTRLYYYRCRDGLMQLTVQPVSDSLLIVVGSSW